MRIQTFSSREFNQDVSGAKNAAVHGPVFISVITVLVHGMTLVPRNVSDFESTGVDVFNPWNA